MHIKPTGHQRRNVIVAITASGIEKPWRWIQLIGIHVRRNAAVFRSKPYPGG
ncbi:MAG: hypothetical protein IPJ18_08495 [Betaproteobacteria bacterium]|nr:hypothetical protein [Betaproteobacteria bacterium]